MATLAGISLALVLLALNPAISGIEVCPAGQTAARPGSCPPIRIYCDIFPLQPRCSCDAQCPGVQKCCRLSCGIGCEDPIFPVHPGQCPTGTFHCPMMNGTNTAPECANDGDCSLPKKCCKVCGQKCVDPQPVHPGECPPQIFLCPNMNGTNPAPECAHDGDCSLPKKCCNRCGQKCVDPQPEVKQGKCPRPPFCPESGPTTAPPPCRSDGDCEGTLKCCNSCGLMCLPPDTAESVPANN